LVRVLFVGHLISNALWKVYTERCHFWHHLHIVYDVTFMALSN